MKSLRQIFTEYRSCDQAIPAFNIDSFEIYQAIELAVRDTGLPCIVQLSLNEDQFIQAERLFILVRKANLDGLPIYLNMDHGQDTDRLLESVSLGYDMVHFDGSNLDYLVNLRTATQFIQTAKEINPDIIVETEFNRLQSDNFTNPQTALDFVGRTKTDLLAVSLGNRHGVDHSHPENLDLNLLAQIHQILPRTLLTLHGGSGISPSQISVAIKLGIVKININTDLRLSFKSSLQKYLSEINSEKIYDYLSPAVLDLKKVIKQKLLQFSAT